MSTQPQQPELSLSFFNSIGETTDYLIDELVATLHGDIVELADKEDEGDQCAELAAKVDDIEAVAPLLQAVPAILSLLEQAEQQDAALKRAERAPDGNDYLALVQIIYGMRRAFSPNAAQLASNLAKLPAKAFVANTVHAEGPHGMPPVLGITRGEKGYNPVYTDFSAAELNEAEGVTPAQALAMFYGSLFGWGAPAADPDHPVNAKAK